MPPPPKKSYYHSPCGSPMKGHKRSSDGSWICPEVELGRYTGPPALQPQSSDSPKLAPQDWNRSSSPAWPPPSSSPLPVRRTPPAPQVRPPQWDTPTLMHRANMKQIQPSKPHSSIPLNAPTQIIGDETPAQSFLPPQQPPERPAEDDPEDAGANGSSSTITSSGSNFRRFVKDSRMIGAIFRTTRDDVPDLVNYLANADVHFSIVGRPSNERTSPAEANSRVVHSPPVGRDPSCLVVMAQDEQMMNVLANGHRVQQEGGGLRSTSEPLGHGYLDIIRDERRTPGPPGFRHRGDIPPYAEDPHHLFPPPPMFGLPDALPHHTSSSPSHNLPAPHPYGGYDIAPARHPSVGPRGSPSRFSSVTPSEREQMLISQNMYNSNISPPLTPIKIFALGLFGALTAVFGCWLLYAFKFSS
ncbi:hypothetical protein AX16_007478 [Volvariella volvacea WC 439]|nr:hypothetical protein AX16_007478 [Volvariella volvacea WC 439]